MLTNADLISRWITQIWDAEVIIEPSYSDEFSVEMSIMAGIDFG